MSAVKNVARLELSPHLMGLLLMCKKEKRNSKLRLAGYSVVC